MKYGRQLEHDSVPEWSLHNLDYNSLKHEIKVHTTRDQATAIAIPGHQDPSLRRFEDGLYLELCRQHDRVDLFVSSKADEIARRLDSIDGNVRRWIARCTDELNATAALKRQRRLAKYERELRRCEDDVHALERFAKAQIVAFRKILKKYKKWTGSTTLGARFADSVLSNPKSFTRRDFKHLQIRHDDILKGLHDATPLLSEPTSSSDEPPTPELYHPRRQQPRIDFEPLPPSSEQSQQGKYWNEYDDGSDAEPEDDYAIYINHEGGASFPVLGYVQAVLSLPFEKAKQWFRPQRHSERAPLLSPGNSNLEYASTAANTDSDEEGSIGFDGMPVRGYATMYAFPSIGEQKVVRYRENVLKWATAGGFLASFILLAIASVLITTGKHKLRVEVDAAVTVGIVISLFCACSALGMTMYRNDPLTILYRLMIWSTFITSCLLNGMLLVLVVGNTP